MSRFSIPDSVRQPSALRSAGAVACLITVGFISALAGCGGGGSSFPTTTTTATATPTPTATASPTPTPTPTTTAAVTVAVTPTAASLAVGGMQTFTATVANATDTSVTWSVPEGSTGGTITSAGVYTAPATAGTYHVVATSVADTAVTATAAVTVTVQTGNGVVAVN